MMELLDSAATHAINSLSGHLISLDFLMIWLSAAGVPLMVLAVVAQWWLKANRTHNRHILLSAGFSFLIGLGLNQLVLLFVHRIRPYDAGVTNLLIEKSSDFSFPSDHATAAFAITAAFLLMDARYRGAAFFAAALLIAFSRVYLGTHYVTDVLGGALTGTLAALFVRLAYREDTKLDRLLTKIL